MTAIWILDGTQWRLVAPSGFPVEAALPNLVEQAPNMLPLSGSPLLTIVGREVYLGGNKADLIAVEPSGRLVIIEIKLAKGGEARRAVVAQILTYAAFLRGLSVQAVERDILGSHLERRGYSDLATAIAANDQSGAFVASAFREALSESVAGGRFRLILVLDDAPPELVQLVGYLEAVADKLVIDLVTVSAYDIGGQQVMVPQRIEPERLASSDSGGSAIPTVQQPPVGASTRYIAGSEAFEASIATAADDERPKLARLLDWARSLEMEGLVFLETTIGTANRWALRPLLRTDKAGLVTIWNQNGGGIQFWRSKFESRAPKALSEIERLQEMPTIGQGNSVSDLAEGLLELLAAAYREAGSGHLSGPAAEVTALKKGGESSTEHRSL